jgi:hypothetical protein
LIVVSAEKALKNPTVLELEVNGVMDALERAKAYVKSGSGLEQKLIEIHGLGLAKLENGYFGCSPLRERVSGRRNRAPRTALTA